MAEHVLITMAIMSVVASLVTKGRTVSKVRPIVITDITYFFIGTTYFDTILLKVTRIPYLSSLSNVLVKIFSEAAWATNACRL